MRIIGFLILFGSFGLIGHEIYNYLNFTESSPQKKLEYFWHRDTKTLLKNKKLPKAWNDIKEIDFFGGTKEEKNWIQSIKSPVPINKKGQHKMEILLLTWKDGERFGAIIQYDIINIKSGNLLWELGRTYILKEGRSEHQLERIAIAKVRKKKQKKRKN